MGKIKLTIEDLFSLPTAVIYNPDCYRSISRVEIDSRKVNKNTLFVAIKGEKLDGHNFVASAIANGAKAVVINSKSYRKFRALEIPVITVEDTSKAYGDLAAIWRSKLKAKVIAITGSNGKTTTKEMLSTLLQEKFRVVKTLANNNNHIGVPLTIFSADEKCEMLVLEQGTNHFGEIAYTANISKPDYAILTNIGDSHLEFLKNRQGVYKEKSSLFDVTQSSGGKLFLNFDDPIIRSKQNLFKNKITYGFAGKVDVKGKIKGYTADGRIKIEIKRNGQAFEASLPVYGQSSAKNFLGAAAIAFELGLSKDEILSGSQKLTPVHGRLEVKKFNEAMIIDDTYNANPASVESAVELVKRVKTYKNKIILLGDLFELGKSSSRLHKELEKLFEPNKNLMVLTIGNYMKQLHKALRFKKVKAIHFDDREALSLYLHFEELENSLILVKGSRGMMMEEFVNQIKQRFA